MQNNDNKCGLIIHVSRGSYLYLDVIIVNRDTLNWIQCGGEIPANQLSLYAESCDIGLEEAKKEVAEFKDDITTRAYEASSDFGIGNRCMDLVEAINFIQAKKLEVLVSYEVETEQDESGARLSNMGRNESQSVDRLW